MSEESMDPKLFDEFSWFEVIEQAKRKSCDIYNSGFQKKQSEAEENGDEDEVQFYRMLSKLTSFILRPVGTDQVFTPMRAWSDGSRTAMPEDMDDVELDLLQKVFPVKIEDPEIKARVGDTLWLRRRDHKAALEAIESYLNSLNNEDFSNYSLTKIRRAVELSRSLGKASKKQSELAVDLIKSKIEEFKEDLTKGFWLRDLIRLLLENADLDLDYYAKLANNFADRVKETNHRSAVALWEESSRIFEKSGNPDKSKSCIVKIAEMYSKIAESEKSAMISADYYIKAIEAFRRVPGAEKQRSELHIKLLEKQKYIPEQLTSISTSYEIPKEVFQAANEVSGMNLENALFHLSLCEHPISYSDLKKQVEESAKNYPMSYVIGSTSINDMGKNVAKVPSIMGENFEAIEMHMVNDASMHRQFCVISRINPIRRIIIREHSINYTDLIGYAKNHPFIKNDHELLIIDAIVRGFYDDFVYAGMVLSTQFEECLRHLMRSNGIITSSLDQNGIQKELTLTELMDHDFTREVFGEDLVFEFKSILVHPNGPNIRNRVAHGLMTYHSFYSYDVIYFWWLFLRLLCLPSINIKHRELKDIDNESADDESSKSEEE